MDLPTQSDVVESIDAFLSRHEMTPTRFGAEATGDANLIAALRKGASPRLERLHRIREYMARTDAKLDGPDHGEVDNPSQPSPSSGTDADLSARAEALS